MKLRPVEEGLDAGFGQNREPLYGPLQDRLEMVKILRKRVELEILGNAVHAPGLGIRLKSAKQDLACVFLVVGALVRHPQHRQIRGQPVDAFGHDVKVLAGMKRHGDAGLGADLTGPHSARIDDVVGLDRPLIRHHACHPSFGFLDVGDLDALNDLHAKLRAPLASAWVIFTGSACPSFGRKTPPTTSSIFSPG